MPLFPLLMLAAQPQSAFFTAQELKARCQTAAGVTDCFAFIQGAYDTSRAYQEWMNFREFCVPSGITRGELRDAALRYLDLHPTQGDAQAASVVILALKDRFPCAAGPQPPAPGPTPTPPSTIVPPRR